MKKGTLTLLCLLCAFFSYAQDVIVKKNGDEIQAKILEITPSLIKFKRFDYQDGPTISLEKGEVFMVKYANGSKEVINSPASSPSVPNAVTQLPEIQQGIQLSGPRLGFTVLTGNVADKAKEEHNVSPFITQFGWQFETRIFTTSGGVSGLAEIVPLVGGLEQGKFIPSLSGLVGIRGPKGFEFGVGPNVSATGAALVLALGTNLQTEGINFPINLAVVPNSDGARISLLFGFNSRKY
ncbi:MAG: hypothetical protein ACO1OQ_09190 [Rufibacter sp.]